ncbi:MAG: BlaI/MecI/CopY family transcriptional regulator [Bacteroidales bacterium]|jgi:BlaI family penicillinase repressor|nr:BlaI/MecI/CopY family transcriptional regulator [Bacteroidota bacterium]
MRLTKAEEQIMQYFWEMGETRVSLIRDRFSDPKPARNTVSTVVRVLESKGFVGHRDWSGRGYIYFPLVSKEEYTRTLMSRLLKGYFNNSFPALASFFAKENDLSIKEMDELLEEVKKDLEKNNPEK